ncbi:GNAT family N-acetyltransferase [Bacillus sp. FJAT-42315]|uniref:GNAT family N-acetyltransferase n=1 Tax=Bacillus sp. FJAT-42315 TaxID=2014077 RepID=UPI000C238E07|nr:GNAT family N-acetyltransferase [Bacillus sp. FJAT-42315]
MSHTYTIRLFETYEDFKKMADLERLIWGIEPIPENQTMIAHKNGGLALGAFDGDQLIGFSYSFAGFREGHSYLCSHNLGIHPDYQKQGIGDALKKAQRQEAIKLGYSLITWTYDPLESVNGYLNLSKLNGVCRTYIEDCYGDMPDSFSEGMPTDRFMIEWHIKEDYLDQPNEWSEEGAKMAASWGANEDGILFIDELNVQLEGEKWLVPVPKNFQEIRQTNSQVALQWKKTYRKLFNQLFDAGYVAVKLIRTKEEHVNYYLLVKQEQLPF